MDNRSIAEEDAKNAINCAEKIEKLIEGSSVDV